MKVKISEIVKYKGHTVSQNGTVKVNFVAMYSELTKTIQTLQMLNNDIKILCKLSGQKFQLGMFRIKNVIIGDDGESTLKFETLSDYVEMDNLNRIIIPDEFEILMLSNIEMEGDDE